VNNIYVHTILIFLSLGGSKVPEVQIRYIRLSAISLQVLMFYRGVVENFGLLGCDFASLDKWLPAFRKNVDKSLPSDEASRSQGRNPRLTGFIYSPRGSDTIIRC